MLVINEIVYPDAPAQLSVLKQEFKQQNDISDSVKVAWNKYKSGLTTWSNNTKSFLQVNPIEFQQFTGYLDSLITSENNVSGTEFITKFENSFKKTDVKTQCGLLQFFYDQQRLKLLTNDQGSIKTTEQTKSISGTKYSTAEASLMGGHTLVVNSDDYKIGDNENSPLIAVVSDGITFTHEDPKNNLYTGKVFAHNLVSQVEPSLEKIFGLSIKNPDEVFFHNIENLTLTKLIDKLQIDNRTNLTTAYTNAIQAQINIHPDGIPLVSLFLMFKYAHKLHNGQIVPVINFPKISRATSSKDLNKYRDNYRALVEDAKEFFLDLIKKPNGILNLLMDGNNKLAMVADHAFETTEAHCKNAAMLAFAVDLGKEIGFVAKGDSSVIVMKKDRSIQSLQGDSILETKTFQLAKKDVAAFLIVSDGIVYDHKALQTFETILHESFTNPETIDPQQLVRTALKFAVKRGDDKTVVAVKVQS